LGGRKKILPMKGSGIKKEEIIRLKGAKLGAERLACKSPQLNQGE
jgi:hypothetical protein